MFNPNRGIEIHPQEHQKSGADFIISSKKHQFLKHQRRSWQQISKIGEKSERERNFNIASKTACRGFKSFCPCHRSTNGCRLVHHQKSISKFPEKDGSVPCAVDGELAEKRNASFLFNLVVYLKPGFSEKHDEHRLKPHKMDIPRHNYLF